MLIEPYTGQDGPTQLAGSLGTSSGNGATDLRGLDEDGPRCGRDAPMAEYGAHSRPRPVAGTADPRRHVVPAASPAWHGPYPPGPPFARGGRGGEQNAPGRTARTRLGTRQAGHDDRDPGTVARDLPAIEPVRIGPIERFLIKLTGGDPDDLERRARVAIIHLTTGNFVSDTLTGTLAPPRKEANG